jgi:hypothetical protein
LCEDSHVKGVDRASRASTHSAEKRSRKPTAKHTGRLLLDRIGLLRGSDWRGRGGCLTLQTRWCQLSSSLFLLSEKASLRIPWDQFFQGHIDQRSKVPLFDSHHWSRLSCSTTGNEGDPCTLSPPHLSSEEPGGVALQGARCVSSCSGGRNHSETKVGCIVSWTTATNCSRNWERSTS